MNLHDPHEQKRWLAVLAAVAVASTLVGFLVATRRAPEPGGYRPPRLARASAEERAPSYAQLANGRMSDNRTRHAAALAALAPGVLPPQVLPHDEAAWQASTASRAERRAYDGAPPLIPHPIEQRGFPSCRSCHERALRIGSMTAPAPSHDLHTSCTQCHAVAQSPVPLMAALPEGPALGSDFVGLQSAGKGARAWVGAPPEIPHPTFMREKCASCHGAMSTGLHSSHPARQSCTQCHALSAQLDQRPGLLATQRAGKGALP